MNTSSRSAIALAAGLALLSGTAGAATVSWTDWTATTATAPGVVGTLDVDGTAVDVTFSGAYDVAQTAGGTNFWSPTSPYLSGLVDNAPPASDIIRLITGGTATITFSKAVTDPLIGLVSWNGNTVDFGVPIEILSFGAGYWGSGTPILNAGGTGFFGSGEVHGVIRLPGTYSSISFSHTSENWHGLTVGVVGIAPAIPEPSTYALLGAGLLAVSLVARRRRR